MYSWSIVALTAVRLDKKCVVELSPKYPDANNNCLTWS